LLAPGERAGLWHGGQICMTTGRHLIADRVYDD